MCEGILHIPSLSHLRKVSIIPPYLIISSWSNFSNYPTNMMYCIDFGTRTQFNTKFSITGYNVFSNVTTELQCSLLIALSFSLHRNPDWGLLLTLNWWHRPFADRAIRIVFPVDFLGNSSLNRQPHCISTMLNWISSLSKKQWFLNHQRFRLTMSEIEPRNLKFEKLLR